MSFLGVSQQNTLQHIGELLVELRQLIDAQAESIRPAKFGRLLTEEAPSSNSGVHLPQPKGASSTRTWRPPPSRTTGEFVPTRVRTETPLFNGDDPLGWIFGIQDYFNYFLTDESVRLAVVEKIIEQPALDWFRYYQKTHANGSWEEFLVAVCHHFAPELFEGDSHMVDHVHHTEVVVNGRTTIGLVSSILESDRELGCTNIVTDAGSLPMAEEIPSDTIPVEHSDGTRDEAMESHPKRENFPDEDEFAKENSVDVFEDKDGDDAFLSVEFAQIIGDPLFVDVPSVVIVPNDGVVPDDGVVPSDVIVLNDGVILDFPSDVGIPDYGIGLRVRFLLRHYVGVCCATLQFGAVEGIHIFDPGAGAFESFDSRAGENSSRLQHCPKFQDPKSYQDLLRREKALASDARSIPPRKEVKCSGRSFSSGWRLRAGACILHSSTTLKLENAQLGIGDLREHIHTSPIPVLLPLTLEMENSVGDLMDSKTIEVTYCGDGVWRYGILQVGHAHLQKVSLRESIGDEQKDRNFDPRGSFAVEFADQKFINRKKRCGSRHHVEFSEGFKVFFKLQPCQRSLNGLPLAANLVRRFYSLFTILVRIGVAFQHQLYADARTIPPRDGERVIERVFSHPQLLQIDCFWPIQFSTTREEKRDQAEEHGIVYRIGGMYCESGVSVGDHMRVYLAEIAAPKIADELQPECDDDVENDHPFKASCIDQSTSVIISDELINREDYDNDDDRSDDNCELWQVLIKGFKTMTAMKTHSLRVMEVSTVVGSISICFDVFNGSVCYPDVRLEGKSNFMGEGVDRGLILPGKRTNSTAPTPPRSPTDRAHPQLDTIPTKPQLEVSSKPAHVPSTISLNHATTSQAQPIHEAKPRLQISRISLIIYVMLF